MHAPTATTTTKKTRGPRSARSTTPAPAPRVRHMHDDAYWCESRSHPGTGHHCTPHSCTCPAGRWNRTCWHRTFVRGYHQWRQEQMAHSGRQTEQPVPQLASESERDQEQRLWDAMEQRREALFALLGEVEGLEDRDSARGMGS